MNMLLQGIDEYSKDRLSLHVLVTLIALTAIPCFDYSICGKHVQALCIS